VLKDWSVRGKSLDLLSMFNSLNAAMSQIEEARILVLPPPAIQGIGNAAGFTMQVELRDASFDLDKLQAVTNTMVSNGLSQTGLQRVQSSFRSTVPQIDIEVDRIKVETLHLTVDQVFSALSGYLGASFVTQFNKFGRVFQIYVQADASFRLRVRDIENLSVRNSLGQMIPLGTVIKIGPTVGPSLVSLYNLYPSSTIIGLPATGFSSGQAISMMEQIADRTLPRGVGYQWTGLLLVYLVLAGQYESWSAPISVILAVPLALLGPVLVLRAAGVDNNLYIQIGLILLIALSAKNAILIVEVARERRLREGHPIMQAAVEAAKARLRPILMTSFAFILGVAPLVVATGAGASARKSIGITVFSGMIASTCLAVVFVPSFFVVVQRFEEWRAARRKPKPELTERLAAQ